MPTVPVQLRETPFAPKSLISLGGTPKRDPWHSRCSSYSVRSTAYHFHLYAFPRSNT
jgi:hypothetical protein